MRTPCWFENQAARVTTAVLVHTDLAVYFRDMAEADGPTQIVSRTTIPCELTLSFLFARPPTWLDS